MALIHNHVTVVGDDIIYDLFAIQTLDYRYVNDPSWPATTAADLPNVLDGQIQKCSQPLALLVKKLAAVNEYKRVGFSCRNQPSGNDGFAEGSRCA